MNGTSEQRLAKLHDAIQDHRLTLCIAPAGYGKSALLKAYAGQPPSSTCVHYCSLTKSENTAQALLARLFLAVGPETSAQEFSINALLSSLESHPCVVILDAYDNVDTADVGQLILSLINRAPENVRFVIGSRSEPGFSFNKLLLAGEATVLSLDELRFSEAETYQLLAQFVNKQALSEAVVKLIYQRTEGWPIAINLCGLLLKRQGNTDFLNHFSGSDQYLSDYLTEQVMQDLPDDLCRFCASISYFDEVSEDLVAAILGGETARTALQQLYRQGVFLESVDRNARRFRFHPLFREYLAASSWQLLDEQRINLFSRASLWAVNHQRSVDAIDYAIEAADFAAATALLNESAQTFIRDQGLLPKLINWCEKIPLNSTMASIQLHFWLAWAFCFSCLFAQAQRSIEQLHQVLKKLKNVSRPERHTLEGRVQSIKLALEIFQDNSEWTYVEAERWLSVYQKEADPFDISVVASARFLSARLLLKTADAKAAIAIAKNTIPRANSLYGTMWIKALDGLCEMEFGDQRVAFKSLFEAYKSLSASEVKVSPIRSTIALLCAKACYETGDVELAKNLLPDGLVHIHQHGLTESAAAGIRLEFYLALHQGHDQARFVLSKAEFLAGSYTPRLTFVVRKLRIELLLRENHIDAALAEAKLAGILVEEQKISVEKSITCLIQSEKIRLCVLLNYHLGRISEALANIEDLLAQDFTPQRPLFYVEILIIHSAALIQDHSHQRALRQLTKAFKVALEFGIYQTFIDHKHYLERPLHELILRRQRENFLIEDQLVVRLEKDLQLVPGHEANSSTIVDLALSEREKELLQLLPTSLNVQQMADYLFVSKATVKTHLHHIYRKLGVVNRTGALEVAKQYQLL